MKNFKTVLGFELGEYFKSKGFVISTFLIAVLGVIILSLPNFIDLGFNKGIEGQVESMMSTDDSKVIIYDKGGCLTEDLVKQAFPLAQFVTSEDAVKEAVTNKDADKGYVINSVTDFKIYVYNTKMYSVEDAVMTELLTIINKASFAAEHNFSYEELDAGINPKINSEEVILGKDTKQNFWYCYGLVIIIFMMIVIYGQMIATSVAKEKSNRSIEVLVTTVSPTSLLFGKVIAGAIASVFQMGIILTAVLTTYSINRELWGGMLDIMFNIPTEVLITFAVFGVGGYLFFAFIYGAIGALVSKTEDISKSSGGVMIIIMVVYLLSLIQLNNVDGAIMKVLSFLPFSSYSAMFSRVAMGSVSMVEIIISAVILIASIIGAGYLGAKIYRMGTLHYGNPIKFSTALKNIKNNK